MNIEITMFSKDTKEPTFPTSDIGYRDILPGYYQFDEIYNILVSSPIHLGNIALPPIPFCTYFPLAA